jgi:hypothetical protein
VQVPKMVLMIMREQRHAKKPDPLKEDRHRDRHDLETDQVRCEEAFKRIDGGKKGRKGMN